MMKSYPLLVVFLFFLSSCATTTNKPAWITKSNKLVEQYSLAYAELSPESGSHLGYDQFDAEVSTPSIESEKIYIKFYQQWLSKFKHAHASETDPNVKLDLLIMTNVLSKSIDNQKLSVKYGAIEVPKASLYIYYGLFSLLNPQSKKHRKLAAVDRFKKYIRGTEKSTGHIQMYKKILLYDLKRFKKNNRLMSLRKEVIKYLKESPSYVAGVQQMLSQSGRDDWKDEFAIFEKQVKEYDLFVKQSILPLTRKNFRLPREIYQSLLLDYGVNENPLSLYKRARKDFQKEYEEYKKIAKTVAQENNFKTSDPAKVIQLLKNKSALSNFDPIKMYRKADQKIEALIVKHQLISIPKSQLHIRAGSEAESLAQPVPHLNIPPLINNTGQRPEFIVPVVKTGKAPYDDFTYESAAMALTAHEGRPGHDLQFGTILDSGISTVRASYAMNSANAEGWALYAEKVIYPYMNSEEKLAGLKLRLLRTVRAFCDPGLHLGKISVQNCKNILVKGLGISPQFAELEINRYTFKSPGQATAYYYGLGQILALKNQVLINNPTISEKCFNDKVVSLGLLPLEILSTVVLNDLKNGCLKL